MEKMKFNKNEYREEERRIIKRIILEEIEDNIKSIAWNGRRLEEKI